MAKAMKLRDVEKALTKAGCEVLRDKGPHTVWVCPCGQHKQAIPRHADVSAGVVKDTTEKMKCLEEGWLQ